MKYPILVVDDDRYLLLALRQTLELAGFPVKTFDRSPEALQAALTGQFAAVLADIRLPELDGMALLARLHQARPDIPIILITGHGDVALAVKAVKEGAYDFLQKPVDEEALLGALGRAVEKSALIRENRALQASLDASRAGRTAFYGIIGAHPAMRQVYALIETIATAPDPVLISGETGSGKELAAHALHALSATGNAAPFIAVNMAALPAEMMESELFGYERGAFTGAESRKVGKFEFAGAGTIFLDEICSLPIALQGKLLRVLEERGFSRLGGNEIIPLKARIISATNRDLEAEIQAGRFREDLYFRLNVLPLKIPSLAERAADIPLLARHFVEEYNLLHNGEPVALSPEFLDELSRRPWPGNVRELKNHVRRHCILGGQPAEHAAQRQKESGSASGNATAPPTNIPAVPDPLSAWKEHMEAAEKRYIIAVLTRTNGQVSAASQLMGLSRKSVYEKINRLGIDLDAVRRGE